MLLGLLFRKILMFPLCYLHRSIPLRPLVCFDSILSHPVSSIYSISFFPSAFSTLSLDFLFPSLLSSSQFLAPLAPILPLKSPSKSIHSSLFSFIFDTSYCCLHFLAIYCHFIIFYHLFPTCRFLSIHTSSPFSCPISLILIIIPPAALPFFFPGFAP
jgi:hypothetical protein